MEFPVVGNLLFPIVSGGKNVMGKVYGEAPWHRKVIYSYTGGCRMGNLCLRGYNEHWNLLKEDVLLDRNKECLDIELACNH